MIRLLAVHQGGGLGGAPVSLLKLLAALDATEFHAGLVLTEAGPLRDYAAELQVPASVVPTGGALFASAHAQLGARSVAHFLRTFPGAVQTAQQYLLRTRPDVLNLNTSVLLAWAAAARRARTPVVWTVREVLSSLPWLRRWQVSFIQRHAQRIVVTSQAVAACFPSLARLSCVPNAVDLREFRLDLLQERSAVRSELGLQPDDLVLMLIGTPQRPKGHWLVLDALERLQSEAMRPKLVLVSGGVSSRYGQTWRGRTKRLLQRPLDNLDQLLRDVARRGLGPQVRVSGFRTDIPRLLSAADLVLFPSLAPEGFGRPIIEAMAMQRPVVATAIGPSRDLLGPDAGVLVPPRADALAEAIRGLLEAPAQRESMGTAGRARVEACFGLERQVAAMATIYREAVRSA